MPETRVLTQEQAIAFCREVVQSSFRHACAEISAFVGELGSWDALPSGFSISGERWHDAEALIERVAACGDIVGTFDACDAYRQRITAYLNQWRQLMSSKAKAA